MGRRAYKKVTVNGSVTLHQRYVYLGYLQIACIDLTRSHHPVMRLVTWDPTQPIATRPLAIRKDGSWFTYGWDLTKNICEIFGPAGYPRTTYTYSPFGEVTASGDVAQSIQWSSEVWDSELGLVYYNWRYYNTMIGRWTKRDVVHSYNLYSYIKNHVSFKFDLLGAIANCSKKNLGARICYLNGFGISSYILNTHKPFELELKDNLSYLKKVDAFSKAANATRGIPFAAGSGVNVSNAIFQSAAELTAEYIEDEMSIFNFEKTFEKFFRTRNEIYMNYSAIFDVKLRVDACVCEYPWYLIGGPYYKWKTVEEPIKRYVFFLGYPEKLENSYNYIKMPDPADKVGSEEIIKILFAALMECEQEQSLIK